MQVSQLLCGEIIRFHAAFRTTKSSLVLCWILAEFELECRIQWTCSGCMTVANCIKTWYWIHSGAGDKERKTYPFPPSPESTLTRKMGFDVVYRAPSTDHLSSGLKLSDQSKQVSDHCQGSVSSSYVDVLHPDDTLQTWVLRLVHLLR